ncbi:MAG: GatB/YqeY domain-containing protein [Myxococcota bacterium]
MPITMDLAQEKMMLDTLKNDLKTAMRARDKGRTGTLRLLISALKNAQIAQGGELNTQQTIDLLSSEAKRRREAAEAYRKGDRAELAAQEDAELAIIQEYLPKQLTEDEVRAIAAEVIASVQPTSARDMGKVMGQVMPKLKGRFDGKAASGIVREVFNAAIAS